MSSEKFEQSSWLNFTPKYGFCEANFHYTGYNWLNLSVFLGISFVIFSLRKKATYQQVKSRLFPNIIYLTSALVLPFVLLPIILLFFLNKITNVYLKLKYGKIYGGMLESSDSIWAIEDVSKSIINIFLVVNSKSTVQNFTERLKKVVSEQIFAFPDQFPKLNYRRSSCLGFTFLIKKQLTVEDCVKILRIEELHVLDKSLIEEIISKYSNEELPKNNSALWEMLIFSKPIQEENFAILLRCSHIVGDGLAFINFMLRIFVDNEMLVDKHLQNITKNLRDVEANTVTKLLSIIENCMRYIYIILVAPGIQLYQMFLKNKDKNILHGPALTGHKIAAYCVEDFEKFVPMVKKIKERVPGVTFSDVIFSGVSHGLESYFQKKRSEVPKFVTAAIPALLFLPNMDQKPILQNNFSLALLNLPISATSALHRLAAVKKQTNILRNSPDYLVNYFLISKLCGIIPGPILNPFLGANKVTTSISSVPGLPKISILNGSVVEDIIFFTPHRETSGLSFTILTYDNRFQMGLTVDTALVSSTLDAQSILEGVFGHTQSIYEELFEEIYPEK